MTDLTLGSHLITPRIGYQHHGLYIGDSRVIHFTSTGRIEEVSLSTFADGNGYTHHKYHSLFSRKEIVERAQSRLGHDDYSLIFNNCEHFVNWCIHDKPKSKQVNNAVNTVGTGVAGLAARHLTTQAPTALATLTAAELATVSTGTTLATGFTLLSATPVVPAMVAGYGVFKLVQWLCDD